MKACAGGCPVAAASPGVGESRRLVVPPFHCAWLPDEDAKFGRGRGGVVFEVRGANDATVMLRSTPGANRLQNENSYCVIFGSNRNMCLRIERDGQKCHAAEEDWTLVSPREYRKYWLFFENGTFLVGVGEPSSNFLFRWDDPSPLQDIGHVGLSSWDSHNSYRNYNLYSEPSGPAPRAVAIPKLRDLAQASLVDNLSVATACETLRCLLAFVIPESASLFESLVTFLAKRMSSIGDDFATLPCSAVCALLTSPLLNLHWDDVYGLVEGWSFHGEPPSAAGEIRLEQEIMEVFKHLKFHFMEDDLLQNIMAGHLAQRLPELKTAVEDSIKLKRDMIEGHGVFRKSVLDEEKFRPHMREHGSELKHTFDGDQQGVFHFLGTSSGKYSWMNPMTSKQLAVRASSPVGRFTIPKDVVGDRFSSTSYASPRMENGSEAAWWLVDLGCRQLICTRYAARHDASDGYMRSWSFQGSNDGKQWVDLRRHMHDCTIKFAGAWGSWPVCTDKSYKMFRLLKTGPNASPTQPDKLFLSNLEFYGILSNA